MRKTLVQTLLAAFCAILAAAPLEGGGVMLIGLRNAMFSGGWKNPYITDGLVAMWDSEWNAGGGVRSADLSKIADLSGNGMDAVLSTASTSLPTYSDKGLAFNGGVAYGFQSSDALKAAYTNRTLTIEIVVKVTGYFSSNRGLLSFSPVADNESNINGNPYLRIYADGSYYGDAFYLTNSSSNQVMFGQVFRRDLYINTPYSMSFVMTSSNVKGYYNSVLKETLGNVMIGTTQPANGWIGAKSGNGVIYHGCKGATIYDCRLYSRAMTADEIAANYAVDKARFNLT